MARHSNRRASRPTWVTLVFLILLVVAPFFFIGLIGRSSSPIESSSDIEPLKDPWDFGNVIGIDFGLSYSRVGVMRNNSIVVIPNQRGDSRTPSYVALNDSVTSSFKYHLGLPSLSKSPFGMKHPSNWPVFEVDNAGERRSFTPQEVTALVFRKMKDIAEAFLEEEVTTAVVTVPTSFDDAQRQAIKDAGSITGLNIVRVVKESAAAVIGHGRKRIKYCLVAKAH